ncbi:hypothetical protein ACFV29_42345 [Streptomyces sp. NPDC059690]|uniref:hypothetical protein n=1 Tax=Streptomyces sp. NPDC059690 TaxID=3346907 RepID=UPI0036C9653B
MPGGPGIQAVVVGHAVHAGVLGELQEEQCRKGRVAVGGVQDLGEFLDVEEDGVADELAPQEAGPAIDDEATAARRGIGEGGAAFLDAGAEVAVGEGARCIAL